MAEAHCHWCGGRLPHPGRPMPRLELLRTVDWFVAAAVGGWGTERYWPAGDNYLRAECRAYALARRLSFVERRPWKVWYIQSSDGGFTVEERCRWERGIHQLQPAKPVETEGR